MMNTKIVQAKAKYDGAWDKLFSFISDNQLKDEALWNLLLAN